MQQMYTQYFILVYANAQTDKWEWQMDEWNVGKMEYWKYEIRICFIGLHALPMKRQTKHNLNFDNWTEIADVNKFTQWIWKV